MTIREKLESGLYDKKMRTIYFTDEQIEKQKERYIFLDNLYREIFADNTDGARFFSAPGRTEVAGNHTDHNHGKVIAAAVNLDAVALAKKTDDGVATIKSAEYTKIDIVDTADLNVHDEEKNRSKALLRGVCAGFVNRGYKIGGFNAVTKTQVLSGSGLSSSAAFEVLIGTILNNLYNDGAVSPVEIAQIAQYAENEYFGKPCGLMDQMACSVGSFVKIDFADPANPIIEPLSFDFEKCGHKLCIVDTRASHADLSDEYGLIRQDMESAAAVFGKSCLREVDEKEFFENLDVVRKKAGDRAVLRGIHFYGENERVDSSAKYLEDGDFDDFLKNITESGHSSFMYNQNVFSAKAPGVQPVSVALAVSEHLLDGRGAYRVHGGGFAGTIQCFVPDAMLEKYVDGIEKIFGEGACYVLSIRPVGGYEVSAE